MDDKIAIIGLACDFPGASNADKFWENLSQGKESISALNDDEILNEGVEPSLINKKGYVKVASVLEKPYDFDASFFYLSRKEAEKMDPQLRRFLEVAWSALENSGYSSERYSGNIGVFASSLMSTYLLNNVYTSKENYNGDIDALIGDISGRMGNDTNYIATRTSFHLNLTGPSLNVQTACSSSLVAVHLASQSLLNGECDMALAGGVSLRFPMNVGYMYEEGGIASKDGKCRAFDAQASGTIFGNGGGAIILKRYEDAIEEGDNILAVVRGSAMNNDGSDKIGYTAPSENGVSQVISEAIAISQVEKESISFIETHGTGTIMGDPIEFKALNNVFSAELGNRKTCTLGAVKTNIGHLSIAAGIAGLIKSVLMLKNKKIPPTLHFTAPNPNCDFENSPFSINAELKDWEVTGDYPRRAGITSIGMGGTNVHVVLEEHESNRTPVIQEDNLDDFDIIPLSAKSSEALEVAENNLLHFLESNENLNLTDISYTYALGRRTFNYRMAVIANSIDELKENLKKRDPNVLIYKQGQPQEKPLIFMFPGQGAQYLNVGLNCYNSNQLFRETFDYCSASIEEDLGFSLVKALYEEKTIDLNQTKFTQLIVFIVEYALTKLLFECGVRPSGMTGHSLGEYTAACISGVFSLEDTLKIILKRGELMESLPSGKMLAISANYTLIKEIIKDKVDIASINEVSVCVVSGDETAMAEVASLLQTEGIPSKYIKVSHAFHSRMMDPIIDDFVNYVDQFTLNEPRIPFISNVTGDWIQSEMAQDPNYWGKHIRSTVRFSEGVDRLLSDEDNVFIEVGPNTILSNYVRRNPNKERGRIILPSIKRTVKGNFEFKEFQNLLKNLWLEGIDINWESYFSWKGQRNRVALPTYPFQRDTFLAVKSNDYKFNSKQPGAVKLKLQDWLFTSSWKSDDTFLRTSDLPTSDTILVFANKSAYSKRLLSFLNDNNFENVYTVHASDQFIIDDKEAQIRVDNPNDYNQLIVKLKEQSNIPKHIFHTWLTGTLDVNEEASDIFESVDHWHTQGNLSCLLLTQALALSNIVTGIQFNIITSDLFVVSGTEINTPHKSIIFPFCKVIPQEYPHIKCRIIDVEESNQSKANFELFEDTIFLLDTDTVALRWPYRWMQHYKKYETPIVRTEDTLSNIKQGGIYLVTGGVGDIGISISKMLSEKYNAKLIIAFREPLEDREEWDQIIAEGTEERMIKHIKNVLILEEMNADFALYNADVGSYSQMKNLVETVNSEFGEINGVIHCAGLPGEKWDRTIALTEEETFAWHYQSKVYGQIVLQKLFDDSNIDFVILMSSIASILGGLRLLPYACANSYLGYAANSANLGRKRNIWSTLHWDVWQHHQDEKRASSSIGRMMDDKTVQHEEGLAIIENVMNNPNRPSQIYISTWDLHYRIEQWNKYISNTEELSKNMDASSVGLDDDISENTTLAFVIELFKNALGNVEIHPQDDFFELGGDSLISVSLLSKIRERYEVDISLANFLDQPTASTLVNMIEEKISSSTINEQILELMQFFEEREISDLINEIV